MQAAAKILTFAFFVCVPLFNGCEEQSAPTPCDGLAKKLEVSREEYLPCAGRIIAAMDRLLPQLEAAQAGDKNAGSQARKTFAELRRLMDQAGLAKIDLSGKTEPFSDRWAEDPLVIHFNKLVFDAYIRYRPGAHPRDIQEGKKYHEKARMLLRSLQAGERRMPPGID